MPLLRLPQLTVWLLRMPESHRSTFHQNDTGSAADAFEPLSNRAEPSLQSYRYSFRRVDERTDQSVEVKGGMNRLQPQKSRRPRASWEEVNRLVTRGIGIGRSRDQ